MRFFKRGDSLQDSESLEESELYPIRADVSDWLCQTLKAEQAEIAEITAESFHSDLASGEVLCELCKLIRRNLAEKPETIRDDLLRTVPWTVPMQDIRIHKVSRSSPFGQAYARDNASLFINFARTMGLPEAILFTSNGLVENQSPRTVLLTVLEVIRRGAKIGVFKQVPQIIEFEREIDAEEARDASPEQAARQDSPHLQRNASEELLVEQKERRPSVSRQQPSKSPAVISMSLDASIHEIAQQCKCEVPFPIVKIGEGKYLFGQGHTKVFCRVLRNHVMIRIGGGWCQLHTYLEKHDVCRMHDKNQQKIRRKSAGSLRQGVTKFFRTGSISQQVFEDTPQASVETAPFSTNDSCSPPPDQQPSDNISVSAWRQDGGDGSAPAQRNGRHISFGSTDSQDCPTRALSEQSSLTDQDTPPSRRSPMRKLSTPEGDPYLLEPLHENSAPCADFDVPAWSDCGSAASSAASLDTKESKSDTVMETLSEGDTIRSCQAHVNTQASSSSLLPHAKSDVRQRKIPSFKSYSGFVSSRLAVKTAGESSNSELNSRDQERSSAGKRERTFTISQATSASSSVQNALSKPMELEGSNRPRRSASFSPNTPAISASARSARAGIAAKAGGAAKAAGTVNAAHVSSVGQHATSVSMTRESKKGNSKSVNSSNSSGNQLPVQPGQRLLGSLVRQRAASFVNATSRPHAPNTATSDPASSKLSTKAPASSTVKDKDAVQRPSFGYIPRARAASVASRFSASSSTASGSKKTIASLTAQSVAVQKEKDVLDTDPLPGSTEQNAGVTVYTTAERCREARRLTNTGGVAARAAALERLAQSQAKSKASSSQVPASDQLQPKSALPRRHNTFGSRQDLRAVSARNATLHNLKAEEKRLSTGTVSADSLSTSSQVSTAKPDLSSVFGDQPPRRTSGPNLAGHIPTQAERRRRTFSGRDSDESGPVAARNAVIEKRAAVQKAEASKALFAGGHSSLLQTSSYRRELASTSSTLDAPHSGARRSTSDRSANRKDAAGGGVRSSRKASQSPSTDSSDASRDFASGRQHSTSSLARASSSESGKFCDGIPQLQVSPVSTPSGRKSSSITNTTGTAQSSSRSSVKSAGRKAPTNANLPGKLDILSQRQEEDLCRRRTKSFSGTMDRYAPVKTKATITPPTTSVHHSTSFAKAKQTEPPSPAQSARSTTGSISPLIHSVTSDSPPPTPRKRSMSVLGSKVRSLAALSPGSLASKGRQQTTPAPTTPTKSTTHRKSRLPSLFHGTNKSPMSSKASAARK